MDAAVQQWGGASEATVSCATGALRGQVIGAAPSRRGERSWMPYPLNPRGEALAAFP